MTKLSTSARWIIAVVALLLLGAAVAFILLEPWAEYEDEEAEAKRYEAVVLEEVVNAPVVQPAAIPAVAAGFTPQTRLGYTEGGDQWEPSIAADRSGHVYMLYPQYGGVPGCQTCYSPTMILQISSD